MVHPDQQTASSAAVPPPPQRDTAPGQAIYTPLTLALYDLWVLGVSNRHAWQTDTSRVIDWMRIHAHPHHLDVGVGTGALIDRAFPKHRPDLSGTKKSLWLLDLNPHSLRYAARRLKRLNPQPVQADILDPTLFQAPLPEMPSGFDSISAFYLLHCLPGPMAEKAPPVFTTLMQWLKPGGCLFGATLLGDGPDTWLGETLMRVYNRRGTFDNRVDSQDALERALSASGFKNIEIKRSGRAALFVGYRRAEL